ncbi:MAG: aminoglycoside phosphotransferase family protein [Clostridia bacterium]|nr:aminoglycoside phosphotransferase family protein [Clostridia bacterium]
MASNTTPIDEIMKAFRIELNIAPYGDGHINDTFVADSTPRYILQRVNTSIFKKPDELMENIVSVTEHLRKKIIAAGGNPDRETLTVINTRDNKPYYTAENGNCYRVYKFITNTISLNLPENPGQFESSAKAFGKFQNMLADFDASKLHETIPNFHHTPKRIEALKEAMENNIAGRKDEVIDVYNEYMKFEEVCCSIQKGLDSGEVPLRVTHNDTKLNNVLFDDKTLEGICVIDLDTVMPGSLLFDYGDSLRFGASTAVEDEADLSKVNFDLEYFESYTRGFLSELGSKITEAEVKLLPLSALILTFECGIRFLTDYLNGDTYFKIHYANQNIIRAKNQLKLVQDINSKLDEMTKIVAKYA